MGNNSCRLIPNEVIHHGDIHAHIFLWATNLAPETDWRRWITPSDMQKARGYAHPFFLSDKGIFRPETSTPYGEISSTYAVEFVQSGVSSTYCVCTYSRFSENAVSQLFFHCIISLVQEDGWLYGKVGKLSVHLLVGFIPRTEINQ